MTGECAECGGEYESLMAWGDRDEMPPICMKCYMNPGWYRE